jgi:hypothetical protein
MRTLGWFCVVLAFIVLIGGIIAGRENMRAYSELCKEGKIWACMRDGMSTVTTGAIAAAILGGFGILILAIRRPSLEEAEDDRIACPFCAEDIKIEAILCPHCRSDLRAANRRA